jgi:phosphatidylserine/phosphatidylglycerophosphate/cardiolipin synthase-like enzyme
MTITFAKAAELVSQRGMNVGTSWGDKPHIRNRRKSQKSQRGIEKLNKMMEAASRKPEDICFDIPVSPKERKRPLRTRNVQKMTVPFIDKKRNVQFLSTDLKDVPKDLFEQAILSAKKKITLIMYAISNHAVIEALKVTAKREVDVTVIYDADQTSNDPLFFGKKVHGYPRGGKDAPMHDKLLVVDDRVWIGSANMSVSSVTQQCNFIVSMKCVTVARRIEALAASMIAKEEFSKPPLDIQFPDTKLSMFFNPMHGDISRKLIRQKISRATQRVFVSMYTFTLQKFGDDLIAAKRRGVDVRVILDCENMKAMNQSIFSLLSKESVACGFRSKKGLLHHKVMLIDEMLVTGSCNLTTAAFDTNDDAMLVMDPVPQKFQSYIQEWWDAVESQSTLGKVQ